MGLKAWLGPPANLAGKKESVASDLIGGVARLREKAAKTRAFIRRRTIKLARRAISERATGYIADTARSPAVRQFDYLGAVMEAPRLVVEIPAQTKLWRCGYVRFPASQWRVQIWRRCPRWAHPR